MSDDIHEYFAEAMTRQSSEALMANMTEHASHGAKRVVLELSTPGDEMESAINTHKALRSTPFKLVTYNGSEVASMGNLIFLAGDERVASPEATFLFHPLRLRTLPGYEWDVDELEDERAMLECKSGDPSLLRELDLGIARLKRQEREVRRIIEQRTSLTDDETRELMQKAEPLGATDALAMGIIHDIVAVGVIASRSLGSTPLIRRAATAPSESAGDLNDLRVFDARVSRRHVLASYAASPPPAAAQRTLRRG